MRPVRANSETVAIERATQPVKWMSRNGNVSALAEGIAMIAALRTLAGLEARADQWHSTRKYGRNAVALRMGFENWAIAHPRTIE